MIAAVAVVVAVVDSSSLVVINHVSSLCSRRENGLRCPDVGNSNV